MRKVSTARLRELEVINLCGGERLGYPCEFEIEIDDGRLVSMIVSDREGIAFFSKKEEYVIPWYMIQCIGEDAILVKIPENELTACINDDKKAKKGKKCR